MQASNGQPIGDAVQSTPSTSEAWLPVVFNLPRIIFWYARIFNGFDFVLGELLVEFEHVSCFIRGLGFGLCGGTCSCNCRYVRLVGILLLADLESANDTVVDAHEFESFLDLVVSVKVAESVEVSDLRSGELRCQADLLDAKTVLRTLVLKACDKLGFTSRTSLPRASVTIDFHD